DVAGDMTNGIIDRFRTMPISSLSVITGHIVASVVRNLLATGVVIGVALLIGFRPSAGILEWLQALGIITLFVLTFTCLYAAIGLVAGSPSAASGYGFALLFLPYLSSAFVPTQTMPLWLRGIANHQPVTPVIESIRGLLTGTPIHKQILWAILPDAVQNPLQTKIKVITYGVVRFMLARIYTRLNYRIQIGKPPGLHQMLECLAVIGSDEFLGA
ncbi:hypothetical protein KC345_g11767, partial [Hortaea werneckii]